MLVTVKLRTMQALWYMENSVHEFRAASVSQLPKEMQHSLPYPDTSHIYYSDKCVEEELMNNGFLKFTDIPLTYFKGKVLVVLESIDVT